MPNVFGGAALLLLADDPETADRPDSRLLLEQLGYAAAEAAGSCSQMRHRAALLRAASRFVRVFELAAPDAPGLVCFGAEFDSALADPLHMGSPLVGVSGVGVSLQVRRPPALQEVKPPFPLSTGSAAGTSWEAAALHGLLELIERDAASLWWQGGKSGKSIPPGDEAGVMAETLLAQLRQDASARRSWLLDITTDIGVPCVAAVSCAADGFGLAIGLAARPTLTAAARSAILEMCQIELAHAVVEAKCRERGEAALNRRDLVHRRRATLIDAERCPLLQPVAERAEHLAISATGAKAMLQLLVDRLGQFGIETFGLDLTRPHFGIPVARVIAPGLQPEPSEIVMPRLANVIARTGGGAAYTGGVALM
jgi:ribosomal protein S12 methylthiotransferase accessory factor